MATTKPKKRRKVVILTLLVAVVATLGGFAAFRKGEPLITVQTGKVARRNLTEVVLANGKVQPVLQVVINPEVSGEIIELPVKEGQQVKKGDLLLRIKPDYYVASRNSAEASYKSSLASKTLAEANYIQAEQEFKRIEALFETELVSETAYDTAKTSFAVCKAQLESAGHQVEMAKAALARSDEDLAKTTIYSPIDGTVTKLKSQTGERVVGTAMMAGTEVMTIANLDEMEARVDIGEIDVVLIKLGQIARLEIDAFRDRKFSGIVTEIANAAKGSGTGNGASAQTGDATKFEVKIRIQEKEQFRPGMSVTAEVETRYRTNVLTVPIQSVTTRPAHALHKGAKEKPVQEKEDPKDSPPPGDPSAKPKKDTAPKAIEVVFLVEGGAAKMKPVKRGISDDEYVEITEGLAEGQEVVSGGYRVISRDLDDDKKVKVDNASKETKPDEEKKA